MAIPAKQKINKKPTVVLVGRVNVGKSTLFNKLIEEQKALVSNIAGTTRTRNEGDVLWHGAYIRLVDTGGLTFDEAVPLEADIIKQTEDALADANMIIFVTDAQSGILPQEYTLAKQLHDQFSDISTLIVANKVDSNKIRVAVDMSGYPKLRLGKPFFVSANSGRNLGDLLDRIYDTLIKQKMLPVDAISELEIETPEKLVETIPTEMRVSIIGKPNVGKSSLFNKLIDEEKSIVSEMAHTTREPHDTEVIYPYTDEEETKEQHITFVDTAGIRRKSKVAGHLERTGIQKSIKIIEESDIVLFVLDGSEVISNQDQQLGGLLEKHGKSVIILLNKWDLSEDASDTKRNEVKKIIYSYFPHLKFAPILFVSGKTGYRIHDIFPFLMQVWKARHTTIVSSGVRRFLERVTREHRPARGKGTRHPDILMMKQVATAPPIFEIVVKYRTSLHSSYVHFLENRLREKFDFFGTPITIHIRKQTK